MFYIFKIFDDKIVKGFCSKFGIISNETIFNKLYCWISNTKIFNSFLIHKMLKFGKLKVFKCSFTIFQFSLSSFLQYLFIQWNAYYGTSYSQSIISNIQTFIRKFCVHKKDIWYAMYSLQKLALWVACVQRICNASLASILGRTNFIHLCENCWTFHPYYNRKYYRTINV